MEQGKRTFVVVSHTHWDREWYQPFETFRARLVQMMDSLIDLLESDPKFKHFVMDGQTVPIDDYLEVRPDRRETIERLIREGRLLAGPNYMLPDEFLIGGEAWVRNLQVGIRSARKYGGVMNVGYSPDAFGHILHLPAILRGFGIDTVLIWRGVPRSIETSEFRWASPDGSEVLVLHFPHGYGMMAAVPEDRDSLANALTNVRNMVEPYATTPFVLLPNGTDHLPAHSGLSSVIDMANEIMSDATMLHGNYPEYASWVRQALGARYNELPLWSSEFRSSERSHVLAGVLSTRMWLKQRYAYCEDLLARYAEPLSAWTHVMRAADAPKPEQTASEKALLDHAWKLLLQNGPHDSVTGCSVDAVYEDVRLRFDKCEQIAEFVLAQATREIAGRAAPAAQPSIVVFNSEAGPRTDVCTVRLRRDGGSVPTSVSDGEGRDWPVQVIGGGHTPGDMRDNVEIAFTASGVPGHGYRTYAMQFGEPLEGTPGGAVHSIENEYFEVTADGRGTLTVTDKRSRMSLPGLNRFVDTGDRGDEYTFCPPERDSVVDAPVRPAEAVVIERGPVRQTLEVRCVYALPARLTDDRTARARDTVECEIISRVRLYAGVPRVEVETEVDNRAEDHRLRVLFPSGIETNVSDSEQHFGVIRRPAAAPEGDPIWFETPVATYPQKTFTDISDGARGLTIANRGLPEYEIVTEPDGTATFALTLLRCVSWLSRHDLSTRRVNAGPPMYTPGAQLPGRWRFEYAIIPHDGDWTASFAEAHRFARPLRATVTRSGKGTIPSEAALVSIDRPEVVVSTVKLAEDDNSLVLRVYNIGEQPTNTLVRPHAPHGDAHMVDLNEENPGPAVVQGGAVRLSLRPNEIATLKFDEA